MLRPHIIDALTAIVGPERCLTDPEILVCYGYDSIMTDMAPDLVVFPMSTAEVAAIMEVASRENIPVTARGAGTSVCGGPVTPRGGISLCFTKMDRILSINTRDRYAVVQPGVINGDLQKALSPHNFFFPPDPGSINFSTLGGNVAVNAGGPRCLKYGVTADYVLGMEAVLASGKVVRFGSKNIKDVTGYDFSALFCGSEGTLGIITEITLRVVPRPESVQTLLVTFDSLDGTAEAVADIIGSGILPAAMELMDRMTINAIEDAVQMGLPREAEGSLLIEVDGTLESCDRERRQIAELVHKHGAVDIEEARTRAEGDRLWKARRLAYGVFAKIAPAIVSEDVTVPVSRVPAMIRKIVEIMQRYELRGGVLAHAGDGNMHPLICTDRRNREEWQRTEKAFAEIFAAAVELEGTLSGEHGVGMAKAEFLPLVIDTNTREFMATIKRAVDPDNILNPGKFI